MTKKEQYIQLRVAGKSRQEVREIMGYTLKAESTYAARLSEEIENRKRLGELPPDAKIDGTPKLTPAEAEHRIAEALGLIERRVEPTPEGAAAKVADPAPAPAVPPMPATRGTDSLSIHGDYCDYVIRIEVRPVAWNVAPGGLAELGVKLAGEMAAVEQLLREAIP